METIHRESLHGTSTYNVLHAIPEDAAEDEDGGMDEHDDDHDDHDDHNGHKHHQAASKKPTLESFDFTDTESMVWRKVCCRAL
jgi:hypothetical protein